MSAPTSTSMLVEFGGRALAFSIDETERENLLVHAQLLSRSLCALQRLIDQRGDTNSVGTAGNSQIAIEFLFEMVASMIEQAHGGAA